MQFLHRLKKLLAKKSSELVTLQSEVYKATSSGQFYRFSSAKRIILLSKLRRLRKRVNKLNWEVKVAVLGGTFAALTPFDKVQAQAIGPFIEQSRLDNPLRPPLPGYRLSPAIVDLDNDGDFDIVFKSDYSYLKIFINDGTGNFSEGGALYADYTGYYGTYTSAIGNGNPSFADLDGDGDMDLVVASNYSYGSTRFYLNNGNGNGALPTFTIQDGPWNGTVGNPFYSIGPSQNNIISQHHFFIDYDTDGDLDLFISGTGSTTADEQLIYYENTGSSFFVETAIPNLPPLFSSDYGNSLSVMVTDADQDGNLDLIVGGPAGDIIFFKGTGSDFIKQTGPWNPVAKSGNPFDGIELVNGPLWPALIDFDSDGDLDIIAGYNPQFLSRVEPLALIENEGNGVFERKTFLDNPLGGASTGSLGTVFFVDVDADGEIDALLGGKYGSALAFYKNTANTFSNASIGSPFENILSTFDTFEGAIPVYVDIDDDGDLDLITGSYYGRITLFLNDNGVLVRQVMDSSNPLSAIGSYSNYDSYSGNYYSVSVGGVSFLDMVDIDNDGDLDLFINSGSGKINFFKNTGDKQNPFFEAPLDPTENPLDKSHIAQFASGYFGNFNDVSPRFVDIDHDGDFDLLLGGYYNSYKYNLNGVFLFQNVGTPEIAQFEMIPAIDPVISYTNYQPSPSAVDADGDGDLDIFIGDRYGNFQYYINTNPAPEVQVNPATINYTYGTGPIIVDASMTLSDADDDEIVKAIISIQGFQTGDLLSFTPQGNVTGIFDPVSGILTLSGVDNRSNYQDVLESVTYNFTGPKPSTAGKSDSKSGKTIVINKSFSVSVLDTDFTTPVPQLIAMTFTVVNIEPVVTASGGDTFYTGSAIVVDAGVTVSDADDVDLVGATIQINSGDFVATEDVLQFSPQNGISGSYNSATGTLTLTGVSSVINYQTALQSVRYSNLLINPANSNRSIEFLVNDGEALSLMTSKDLTINVPPINNAPTITISTLKTVINNSASIDLTTIISDQDGNLDPQSFAILPNVAPTPSRVGTATISGGILTIDYSGTNFAGTDYVTIQACDLDGLCATAEIAIQVEGDIIVRNGISPNGDGKNDYFQLDNITTLGAQNKVSIFNRWGDKVFEVENYDNQSRRFEGKSDAGNDLPSGVYFYKIEFSNGKPELKGYLTLKR